MQAMVLQLQLALVRTYHALTDVHTPACATARHGIAPSAPFAASPNSMFHDTAIILRTLCRLRDLVHGRHVASTNAESHASALQEQEDWTPLEPSVPEHIPAWLRSPASMDSSSSVGRGSASLLNIEPSERSAAASHVAWAKGVSLTTYGILYDEWHAAISGSGTQDACCQGSPSQHIPSTSVGSALGAFHRLLALPVDCDSAVRVITAELGLLSPAAHARLTAEHSILEQELSALENSAHSADACSAAVPLLTCFGTVLGSGLGRSGSVYSTTGDFMQTAVGHSWVFQDIWSANEAPSICAPVSSSADRIRTALATCSLHSNTPLSSKTLRMFGDPWARPPGLSLMPSVLHGAHGDLVRARLISAMRRQAILTAFADRCPNLRSLEIEALYEHRVEGLVPPPHARTTLPRSCLRDQLPSDQWKMRERLLYFCVVQRVLLERAVHAVVRSADEKLHVHMNAARVAVEAGEPLVSSRCDMIKPPLKSNSAMIRSTIAVAQAQEVESAKAQGRSRNSEFYAEATEAVAFGDAAQLCVVLAEPRRTRASLVAAVLISNLINATHCNIGGSAGIRCEAFVQTNATLLMKKDETAAHLASSERWPTYIHAQILWLLSIYHRQTLTDLLPVEIVDSTSGQDRSGADFGGTELSTDGAGVGLDTNSHEDSSDVSGEVGHWSLAEDILLRSPDKEIAALVGNAYEGRPVSQGPALNLIKQAIIKGTIAVTSPAAQTAKLQATVGHHAFSSALEQTCSSLKGQAFQTNTSACEHGAGAAMRPVEIGAKKTTSEMDVVELIAAVASAPGCSLSKSVAASPDDALHTSTSASAPSIAPSPQSPANRFLRLCMNNEACMQLQGWANINVILAAVEDEDTCLTLGAQCIAPLPDARTTRRKALTDLTALAKWRTAAVDGGVLCRDQRGVRTALRSAELQQVAGYEKMRLCHRQADSQSKGERVEGDVEEAAHYDSADALSTILLRRVALRGLLREYEYRLAVALRQQSHQMKYEVMRKMVLSVMLPTELKILTLSAARDEQQIQMLRAELLMLQQLLLRARITTDLRHLRRKRVHKREMQQAVARGALDEPLLAILTSSERRQGLLEGMIVDAHTLLTRRAVELAAKQKRCHQLSRATQRLLLYRQGHGRCGESGDVGVSTSSHAHLSHPSRSRNAPLATVIQGVDGIAGAQWKAMEPQVGTTAAGLPARDSARTFEPFVAYTTNANEVSEAELDPGAITVNTYKTADKSILPPGRLVHALEAVARAERDQGLRRLERDLDSLQAPFSLHNYHINAFNTTGFVASYRSPSSDAPSNK